MKKTVAMLLLVASLVSLAACGGKKDPKPTEPIITDVAQPVTQAMIDALPIASADMSVAELRQLCVDFMRMQTSIAWTPSKDLTYVNRDDTITLKKNNVIGGMPYISLMQGSLYNFMHFYNETNGLVDIDKVMALPGGFETVIANQCSGSTYWAWARVSNAVKYNYTKEMLFGRGCIPIGSYVVPDNWTQYTLQTSTKMICDTNGEQVMYEAYAQLQPADGIVAWVTAGHVRMAAAVPVVVRNSDGTINGKSSKLTVIEQVSSWQKDTQSNGKPISVQGKVDFTYTFEQLLDKSYIPFTIPEFLGTDPVEKATASSSITGDSIVANRLKIMKVSSNYPISYAVISVKDPNGKVLYTTTAYAGGLNVYKNFEINYAIDIDKVSSLANGKNKVEVMLQVGTGEKLVAYSGTLMPNS